MTVGLDNGVEKRPRAAKKTMQKTLTATKIKSHAVCPDSPSRLILLIYFSFFVVITTRCKSSMFSSERPVHSPTQERASSATKTGIPVSLESNLSKFVSKAPPPVIMIP